MLLFSANMSSGMLAMWLVSSAFIVMGLADRSMQMNEGRFMMNNRCGYVLQPDCMRHPNYDPYDKQSLSRVDPPVEPLHISLCVSTFVLVV